MKIALPAPALAGPVSLEQSLYIRRCRRDFSALPLGLQEISQLAWAAQGITSDMEQRTCPSAGALYPLELLVIAGNVQDLETGVYRYAPNTHALLMTARGDVRAALAERGRMQSLVQNAAAVILLTAIYGRTTGKYGQRGIRYVHMEAGHAAQNVCLQAAALGLGTVMVGAFDDDGVREVLNLAPDEAPLYILPVGR
ncbi:MAG TPA: nitroreductase [Desulfobulbaceae bacterium]|nr:nitroreductase [Desulfobulbaceae bacterium]